MTTPTLSTKNLLLRPFTLADVQVMHRILNGRDVLRYFPGSQSLTEEQVERSIGRLLDHWQERGYGLWALESRLNGDLLGRCGLQFIPETEEVEVDFILSRDYWGQGLATEAGLASIQFGFNVLKLDSIVGIVHLKNIASQRVLEKLGMTSRIKTEYFGMAVYRYSIERP
jgi:ribosomal-protein-alanine N-acetyltransferase